GGFGVEARAFVASEGMLGRIEKGVAADAGGAQRGVDFVAAYVGDVRVLRAEDHQEIAADFFGAGERAGVGVLTELAVVDACPVEADGGTEGRLKRGAKGKVAADAESDNADFSGGDARMACEPVQSGAAVFVEIRDWSFCGVLLAARTTGVIERDRGPG